ncbi:MAG: recombination protein RecR [Nitrospinae bacterium]|nr:recombination protein RecR [Nitrospinota bacterium]
MQYYPEVLRQLIDELKKLPGIGQKGAERLAFFLIKRPHENVKSLSDAIIAVKEKIKICSSCNALAESDPCRICSSSKRDAERICVVEESNDMFFIEKMGEFNGMYHVLQGVISPINGIGPSDLKIESLIERVKHSPVKEVIIATNPNMDGETTALYLHKVLSKDGVKVSRIARGIPVGGELEYVDEVTLMKAFEGRTEMK